MTAKPNLGGRPRTRPKATAFDVAVGKRITARLPAANLKQAGLARKLRKSPSQVYRYLSGDTSVDGGTLAKIAKVLGCQVSDLIDGIKAPK